MPKVDIPGVGIVSIPDGPRDEVMARAKQIQEQYKVQPFDFRNQGLGSLVSGGFNRAYEGLKGTVKELVPALAGHMAGNDDYALQQLKEYKDRMTKAEEANPTAFKSYKDVDSFGNGIGYAAETLGELGPDIGAFVASAATGSMGLGALARRGGAKAVEAAAANIAAKRGLTGEAADAAAETLKNRALKQGVGEAGVESAKSLGSKIGIGAASAGINIPDTFQGIYEDTGQMRADIAVPIGAIVSLLDTYLPGRLLNQLSDVGKKRLATEIAAKSDLVPTTWKKEFAKSLGKTAAGEGLTEGAQEVLQIMGSQMAGDPKSLLDPVNLDRVINSAIKGTIGGTMFGAPGSAIQAGQTKRNVAENIEANKPPPPPPPPGTALTVAGEPQQVQAPQRRQVQRNLFEGSPQEQLQQQLGQLVQSGQQPAPPVDLRPPLQLGQASQQQIPSKAPPPIPNMNQQEMFGQPIQAAGQYNEAPNQPQRQVPAAQPTEQQQLPLEGGRTVGQLNVEKKVEQDNLAQVRARAQAALPKLQFEVREIQDRIKRKETSDIERQRLELLLPIIENFAPQYRNTGGLFQAELTKAGLDTKFTPRETELIKRAVDIKSAMSIAENKMGVKEKQAKGPSGPPVQSTLPGFKPKGPAPAVEKAPAPEATQSEVLDDATLQKFGFKTQSGIYKQLLGLKMTKPEDQQKIGNILLNASANAKIKAPIENLKNAGFNVAAKQTELPLEERTNEPRPVSTPSGASVPVPNRPAATPTKGATKPRAPRVANVKDTTERPAGGKEGKPGTLNEIKTPKETNKPVTKVETKPKDEGVSNTAGPEAVKNIQKRIDDLRHEHNSTEDITAKQEIRAEIKETEKALEQTVSNTMKGIAKLREGIEKDKAAGKDVTKREKELQEYIDSVQKPSAFSQAKGKGLLTRNEVQTIASDTVAGWKNAPPVSVVESEKQLPDYIQDQIKKEGIEIVGGVFDPNTGTVYLVSKNLVDAHDVLKTILHEITGHFGLRKILGEKYNQVMNSIYDGNKDVKDRADVKIASGMGKQLAVEEVLAEMAETNTNPTLLQKVVNIIRQTLRAIGVQFKDVTNGEIMQLIKDSRSYVIDGKGTPNGGNISFGAVFNADAPIFYSKLASMVAGAPKQFDNASEQQWRDWITSNFAKNQVKQEELEYSGLSDYLNFGRSKNEKISREQLLQFLKEEGPKVTETIYGENKNEAKIKKLREQRQALYLESKEKRKTLDSMARHIISDKQLTNEVLQNINLEVEARRQELVDDNGFISEDAKKAIKPYDILREYLNQGIVTLKDFKNENGKKSFELYEKVLKEKYNIDAQQDKLYDEVNELEKEETPTKFGRYTTERDESKLKNYRELILTLPTKIIPAEQFDKTKLRVYQNEDFETFSVYDENDNIISPRFDNVDEAKAWKDNPPKIANRLGNKLYEHHHWRGVHNPIVHIRFNEKTDEQGNRVLFIEELQSDWGQDYYKDVNPKVEIETNEPGLGHKRPKLYTAFINNNNYGSATTEEEARKNALAAYKLAYAPQVEQAPFITEPKSYTALAIKRLLRYAADNGYDKISFISGEEVYNRFPMSQEGESTEKGMQTHYDVRIPSVVKDIFKKLGANPNERVEKLKVSNNKKVFSVVIKDQHGREQEHGASESLDRAYDDVVDLYQQKFGGSPVLKENLYDPVTQGLYLAKGERLRGVKLGNVIGMGFDLHTLLTEFVEQPMDFSIKERKINGVKPFFTIDITPETAEKVKQGQAMFSAKGSATYRNNPTAPGVTGKDAKTVFDSIADTIQNAGILSPHRTAQLHEFLTNTVGDTARTAMMYALPVNALGEVAEKAGLKNAKGFSKLINEHSGYVQNLNEMIEPLVRRADTWAKSAGKEMIDRFNKVVYDSTINKVDPTKERKDYSQDLHVEYDRVKAEYNKLNPAGKKLYENMRDAYRAMYQEILKSIEEKINTFVTDPDARAKIKKDVLDKLAKRGEIDPYFALTRKGNKWLSYDLKGEHYVEAYETERERKQQIEQIRKEGGINFQSFSNLSKYNYSKAPSGSFIKGILNILEANAPVEPKNATKEQKEKYNETLAKYKENSDEVLNLYLSTLPETSFAQSFQKRKETLGFKRDAIEALRERMYNTSQQLGRMRYAAKLNKLVDDMREFSENVSKGVNADDNRIINEYIKVFEKHVAHINNPKTSAITKLANTINFNYLLGLNVSSALINLTQVPMIVAPYLAGEHGWGNMQREIGAAYRLYMSSGFERKAEVIGTKGEVDTSRAFPSIANYDFTDPKLSKEIKELAPLFEFAKAQGQLNRNSLYDAVEMDGKKDWGQTINAVTGFMLHHGERMNRQVSLVAAYKLKLKQLEKAGKTGAQAQQEAAEYAVNISELTNGSVAAAGAPLIAKGNLGKVLFMFKRYGVSMYYLQAKLLSEALKGTDAKTRSIARNQFLGIQGMAALFAGVQGLSMFGLAAMVYNMFADDDEDDFETATRKYIGEFAYKGMLNYATGLDIAGRVGLNDLVFRTNPVAQSQTFQENLLQIFGGPIYGVTERVLRGLSLMNEGHMERGIEQILPSTAANIMKGFRYGTEGANTLRGDPMMEDINAYNAFAQALGFTPAELSKQQYINAQEKGIEKAILDKKTKLLRQYNFAKRMGETEEQNEAREKLKELGKKHPGLGINEDTFRNSERAYKEATKRMVNGAQYNKKLMQEHLNSIAEYDGD